MSVFVRVEQAATLPGESPRWIVTMNGVQQGGVYDASGAGNREFMTEEDARQWIESILHGIPFQWEESK